MRLSKAFSEFEVNPVAAASLGQVHRAKMRDGRPVAVKVQRPNIRERVMEDLDALEEIAEFLDHHTEMGRRYGFAQPSTSSGAVSCASSTTARRPRT